MDTKTLADLVIKEIKKNDTLRSVFGGSEIVEEAFEFNRVYEQAGSKASVTGVPQGTRFRFIKRIIGKLIRTHTNQQTGFNSGVMELIRIQQRIILKSLELGNTNDKQRREGVYK